MIRNTGTGLRKHHSFLGSIVYERSAIMRFALRSTRTTCIGLVMSLGALSLLAQQGTTAPSTPDQTAAVPQLKQSPEKKLQSFEPAAD
jgi:hypothetical protein